MLLKQVDQIIEDAKGYEKDQLPMILKRVPHLIHLYSHFVPTLHAERMKSDLRFVSKSATYYCVFYLITCFIFNVNPVIFFVR